MDTEGNDDMSDCIKCPAGTFSNTMGAKEWQTCLACPPGSYSDLDGSHTCQECPAGFATTGVSTNTNTQQGVRRRMRRMM